MIKLEMWIKALTRYCGIRAVINIPLTRYCGVLRSTGDAPAVLLRHDQLDMRYFVRYPCGASDQVLRRFCGVSAAFLRGPALVRAVVGGG